MLTTVSPPNFPAQRRLRLTACRHSAHHPSLRLGQASSALWFLHTRNDGLCLGSRGNGPSILAVVFLMAFRSRPCPLPWPVHAGPDAHTQGARLNIGPRVSGPPPHTLPSNFTQAPWLRFSRSGCLLHDKWVLRDMASPQPNTIWRHGYQSPARDCPRASPALLGYGLLTPPAPSAVHVGLSSTGR